MIVLLALEHRKPQRLPGSSNVRVAVTSKIEDFRVPEMPRAFLRSQGVAPYGDGSRKNALRYSEQATKAERSEIFIAARPQPGFINGHVLFNPHPNGSI